MQTQNPMQTQNEILLKAMLKAIIKSAKTMQDTQNAYSKTLQGSAKIAKKAAENSFYDLIQRTETELAILADNQKSLF